jgi:hypothetical protein
MAKAKPKVSTIKQAVKAYSGKAAFALRTDAPQWVLSQLGALVSCRSAPSSPPRLIRRIGAQGYDAQPKLFGLTSWKRCLGVKP